MNQEQKQKQQSKEERKLPGFYIALCCCVLAIGVAGYFTEKQTERSTRTITASSENKNEDKNESLSVFSDDNEDDELSKTVSSALEIEDSTPSPAPATIYTRESYAEDESAAAEYTIDNPDIDGGAITVSNEIPTFTMPVSGSICGEYSDTLVYNSSLSDWRTHNGVDISADRGCSVTAAADGVVDVVSSDALGGYVEISHADGFVTRYMGLDSTENLTEGKEIKSGEVLGVVGGVKGENVTEPHLHFEMMKDSKYVNPTEYLPQ